MIKKNDKELIYLASPYTHASKKVMYERFEKVLRLTAYLIRKGYVVFSPIAYGHVMAGRYKMPTDWEYWLAFDEKLISKCNRLLVFKLKGWNKSKGVQAEIKIAKKYKIPVEYVFDKIKKGIRTVECACLFNGEHNEKV
jgi:hypothetical protein